MFKIFLDVEIGLVVVLEARDGLHSLFHLILNFVPV